MFHVNYSLICWRIILISCGEVKNLNQPLSENKLTISLLSFKRIVSSNNKPNLFNK